MRIVIDSVLVVSFRRLVILIEPLKDSGWPCLTEEKTERAKMDNDVNVTRKCNSFQRLFVRL